MFDAKEENSYFTLKIHFGNLLHLILIFDGKCVVIEHYKAKARLTSFLVTLAVVPQSMFLLTKSGRGCQGLMWTSHHCSDSRFAVWFGTRALVGKELLELVECSCLVLRCQRSSKQWTSLQALSEVPTTKLHCCQTASKGDPPSAPPRK